LISEIGTVFRWINFPYARYGEKDKPRWFICIGFSSIITSMVTGTEEIFLCTTTTQLDSFKNGGIRKGHRYYIFMPMHLTPNFTFPGRVFCLITL